MKLKMWTVRRRDEFYKLACDGVLRVDSDRIDEDFRRAYDWMAGKLAEKIAPPPGCRYPLWAWWRWGGRQRPMPDLRAAAHLPKGTPGVRIEFTIDATQVLLSDFDGWHAVLNDHYHALDDADYESHLQSIKGMSAEEIARINEASWNRIFISDLGHLDDDVSVQAVFWELHRSQITDIKYFVAR